MEEKLLILNSISLTRMFWLQKEKRKKNEKVEVKQTRIQYLPAGRIYSLKMHHF